MAIRNKFALRPSFGFHGRLARRKGNAGCASPPRLLT